MNSRHITIEGITIKIEGCQDCPCHAENDEMGSHWCQHPKTYDWDIDEESFEDPEDMRRYAVFPKFCLLKEIY